MTKMIACLSQCIGFSLLMMQQLLPAAKKRTKFYLTALPGGDNGQILLYGSIYVSHLVLESIQQDPFSFSLSF